jgi:thiol-disulfide isomerase/thioredoxin
MSVKNSDKTNDWRVRLFGETILLNTPADVVEKDVESGGVVAEQPEPPQGSSSPLVVNAPIPTKTQETTKFFEGYDYIALFFGANYCPFCKKFAPSVIASKPYFEGKKCKVIFVSNDRDLDNFHESCAKVRGLDVMPYDTSKTIVMRDLFGLKTIPALMILKNADFTKDRPMVYSNAREILELDPKLVNFPWSTTEKKQAAPVTAWERLWIHGRHGHWWALGHINVSESHPNEMYMDEHAVRIRAGLLNTITWIAVSNVFWMKDPELASVIFGIVSWEFVFSMIFGLTPFAPLGIIATLLAILLQPQPYWKPAKPKRFAWLIGLSLAISCFVLVQYRHRLGNAYKPSVAAIALTCNLATWLEGNAGFCIGCFIYNNVLVKFFSYEECKECKL